MFTKRIIGYTVETRARETPERENPPEVFPPDVSPARKSPPVSCHTPSVPSSAE